MKPTGPFTSSSSAIPSMVQANNLGLLGCSGKNGYGMKVDSKPGQATRSKRFLAPLSTKANPNPGLPVHLPVPQMVDFQLSILAGEMNTAVAKMSTKMN